MYIKMKTFDQKTDPQRWSTNTMNEAAAKVRDKEMSLAEADVSFDIPKATLFRRFGDEGDDMAHKA